MLQSMRIQKAFQPVLEEVINAFSRSFAEDLHSIYVYGSVAQGIAIIGQSDLDLCVIFKNKPKNLNENIAEISTNLKVLHPFLPKVDVDIGFLDEVLNKHSLQSWGAWIKFFCQHIYGEDLSALFNDVQIDRDVIKAINSGYDADIQGYLRILEASDQTAKELINLKKSLIKRIIRLLPLTLNNIEGWPGNLNDTVAQAIDVYPEQKAAFQYLLKELDHPNVASETSLQEIKNVYLWVDAHII